MDPSIPNSNSSKNLDADGNPLYPSVYAFREFTIINKNGKKKDITNLVTSLYVSEEIFSPILTARIVIRDNVNFFEDFGLDGQEIVKIEIEYLRNPEVTTKVDTLSYEFVVTDYPLFDKTTESINVQQYEINLISPWAYLSRLQQISKGVEGNPVKEIRDIFKTHLAHSHFSQESICQTDNLKAAITKRTPLQVVEYLRRLCYSNEGAPFFIYTSFAEDTIIAKSWTDMVGKKNKVYNTFQMKPFVEEEIGTPANRKELRSKIISLNSNIKLDKLSQSVQGGVGTFMEFFDFGTSQLIEQKELPLDGSFQRRVIPAGDGDVVSGFLDFYKTEFVNTGGADPQGFNFKYLENLTPSNRSKGRQIINDIVNEPVASRVTHYIPTNPYPADGDSMEELYKNSDEGFQNPAYIKAKNFAIARRYAANMESEVHEIGVYGDPNLSASKKIEIEIPKAVDTNELPTGIDESLSGAYIISTSIHAFENGIYTNKLRIIKDTNLA